MNVKIIKGNSPADIHSALEESKHANFKATLAIVLLTTVDYAEKLCSIFDKNNILIFGLTTTEKFTSQGLESDDIVVMLMDINPDHFNIVLYDYEETSVYDAGFGAGIAGKELFANPGFIISPIDFKMSGDELISGLTDAAGADANVMGGVAGNPADFSGIVFTNKQSSKAGLLTLIIDQDKITINGLAISGWKPVGTEKVVTKCEGAWIFTIDHEPAMRVIQRFLGNEMISSEKNNGLIPSDLGYPLQFQRAAGSPIMRPVLLWNTENESIMVGGQVKEGDRFRFSLPPDFDAIDAVVNSTRIIREKNMPDADALIVFSCIGRLGSFGPMITTEIEGIAETWNKPMLGFFSLGEFGKLDEGRCESHGTTVSWVALKEK